MCGLVGWLGSSSGGQSLAVAPGAPPVAQLRRGMDAIAHRGPDDDGLFEAPQVLLGFRRLSILDLTPAGHQPMHSPDGHWTVVFNGEIYNYLELAQELRGLGATFSGHSDTEVLATALQHWGPRALERCNGMWALLAWHAPTETLYAARDPWGIKPLFRLTDGDGMWFASEIKAFKAAGRNLGVANTEVLGRYIHTGLLDDGQATALSEVERLVPGVLYRFERGEQVSAAVYGDGTARIVTPRLFHDGRSDQDYIEAFRGAFLNSVRLRLRSDVPVGASLSGGLDSTAVLCAAARRLDEVGSTACKLAFTAQIPEYDESRYIREVIQQTGATWHVTEAQDSCLVRLAPSFLQMTDEPVHSLAPLAGFLVMELAAAHGIKVILNGQGSDELLGGYQSYEGPAIRTYLAEAGLAEAWRHAQAEVGDKRRAALALVRAEAGALTRYLPALDQRLRQLPTAEQKSVRALVGQLSPLSKPIRKSWDFAGGTLQEALHQSLTRAFLPLYLRIEDQNSSAFSIEARLPFLDPAVVALARRAPARLLRRDGLGKILLRSILPGLVPEAVWKRRDKQGFPVPTQRWLRGPLKPFLAAALDERKLRERNWYDVAEVVRQRDAFFAGGPMSQAMTRIAMVELWMDNSPVAPKG